MSVTRTTLLAGPAAAVFAGRTFFARDGILVTPALESSVVDSDAQGVLDETVSGGPVTIKFTPSAPFGDLLALYPWLDGAAGTSLFGAADSPLALIAANGVRLTFAAVAIVAMPDLVLGAREPVAGSVTFVARGARSLPVGATNRLWSIDTAEMPVAAVGTPELADDFAMTWGGVPWVDLRSRDGVRVSFAMKTRAVVSDANALLDMTLERLVVEARFTPASPSGPTENDLFLALGLEGGLPGRLLSATAQKLEMAGEHLWVELPLAQVVAGELAFDAARSRVGELVFRAERALLMEMVTITEGAPRGEK